MRAARPGDPGFAVVPTYSNAEVENGLGMKTNYTRLFADSDGETHFEDITVELALANFAPSTPPMGVSRSMRATESAFIGGPTGWIGDWHVSSARNLFIVLSGGWEIEASDRERSQVFFTRRLTGGGHYGQRAPVACNQCARLTGAGGPTR